MSVRIFVLRRNVMYKILTRDRAKKKKKYIVKKITGREAMFE